LLTDVQSRTHSEHWHLLTLIKLAELGN
jgi:hypothetical protein